MLYFGIVENAIDPENVGRVQVRVFPYYKDFAVEDLPWAYVVRSTDLGNTFGRGLNQHNLIEGSQVLVEFLDENRQQPIVLGVVPRESDFANLQSYTKHVLKFLNGSEIIVDETPDAEYIKILDTKQNFILMDKSGISIHSGGADQVITIETNGNTRVVSKGDTVISTSRDTAISSNGDTTISTKGNCNIHSSGDTTIDASNLSLKSINGKNKLCSIPACLFTGAPHQSPTSD